MDLTPEQIQEILDQLEGLIRRNSPQDGYDMAIKNVIAEIASDELRKDKRFEDKIRRAIRDWIEQDVLSEAEQRNRPQ